MSGDIAREPPGSMRIPGTPRAKRLAPMSITSGSFKNSGAGTLGHSMSRCEPKTQEFSSIRLIDWLDYNGYTVITKTIKEFVDPVGGRKLKGDMNVDGNPGHGARSVHRPLVLFPGDAATA
jgi:hypothetical protein